MEAKKVQTPKEIYKKFKSKPLEYWTKLDPKTVGQAFKEGNEENGVNNFVLDGKEAGAGTFFLLVAKIAHKADEAEFTEFLAKGELPPIKLSEQEMEAMNGGWCGFMNAVRDSWRSTEQGGSYYNAIASAAKTGWGTGWEQGSFAGGIAGGATSMWSGTLGYGLAKVAPYLS